MIQQLRNLPPFINFTYGYTTFTGKQGQMATVWLNTLYNREAYNFTLQATGAVVVKISDYEYQVSYPEKGTYTIQLTVFSRPTPPLPPVPVKPEDNSNNNPKQETTAGQLNTKSTTGREEPLPIAVAPPKGIVLHSNILEINIT